MRCACMQVTVPAVPHAPPFFWVPAYAPQIWTDDTVDFQVKVLVRSGLGDETYLPPCMNDVSNPYPSMALARWEFEQVCFTAIKDAMNKTGITARQVCARLGWGPSSAMTIERSLECCLLGLGLGV